ncbi:HET-domain-containing protein [Neofusicoccum parvum]|uniref:HET-domain-containing protein n=1 Tax=Neofusicoccum parvum TaxID=310453 RepID=A0ACB5RTA5_9PEZI|nr:HET-domain-containing protein [Neofusicoccum parvum]
MKNGLSLSAFPKTFRDAIAITSRLQVRYLWIDSLCIIQNSREDWAKESGLMCSVYGNSHCNIAATAASNSSEGCFTANPRQTKDARRPFAVRIDWDGWQGAYCAHQSGRDIWDELDGAPLNARAWVHQERLLSPRVVHFGLSQLAWECNEVRVAELSPPGTSVPARGIREFSKQGCASMWIRSEARGPLGSKEFLQRWGYVWSKYAGLRLTRETDRLVALAGIVDKIQPVLKDDFLAGLWRRDLEQQLCWWTPVPCDRRHGTFIAPSWSWASLPDRNAMQDWVAWEDEKICLLKIVDVQIWSDPDGSKYTTTAGFVRARCYLVPATRIYGQWTQILVFSPAGGSITLDLHLYLDCEEDNKIPHIWCVPILARDDIGSDSFGGWLDGLLLEKLDNGNPADQQYRRCGYFVVQDSWRGTNIRAFWNATFYFNQYQASPEYHDGVWRISEKWLMDGSTLDEHLSLYERRDREVQHTITIW